MEKFWFCGKIKFINPPNNHFFIKKFEIHLNRRHESQDPKKSQNSQKMKKSPLLIILENIFYKSVSFVVRCNFNISKKIILSLRGSLLWYLYHLGKWPEENFCNKKIRDLISFEVLIHFLNFCVRSNDFGHLFEILSSI